MTTDTPARLLNLLSLLQTPREWPGSELAERLGVTTRTIRRDIDRLRDLGYPVEAARGAVGGYRLVAGKAMPPLLLEDDEAVAIAVGLRSAAGHTVTGLPEASVRALAKLEQVLPSRLRRRVTILGNATTPLTRWQGPQIDPDVLTVLATGAAGGEKLRFGYRAADGTETKRLVEPAGLVSAGRRWYFVAYDNDRDDWRIFRVDRITKPFLTGVRGAPRKLPAKDAAAYLAARMTEDRPTYEAVATLHAPYKELAPRLGDAATGLEAAGENACVLRTEADSLEWLALRLAALGCEFEVHEPPQLADYLRELSGRVTRAAGGRSSAPAC
ncbi:helix-turn-helix transcriptional regulator [Streptomyces sp. 7N604]|uniref:helix-turn-helix transcriptional regulator n=1 Tax=Streptomyces sp. 7N604 TaxID=3457415 RepID=UPI003FD48269